jgi:hypothetical protein
VLKKSGTFSTRRFREFWPQVDALKGVAASFAVPVFSLFVEKVGYFFNT